MMVVWTPAEAAVTHLPQHHQCGSKHGAAIAELSGWLLAIPIANNQPGVAVRATWSGRGSVV